MKNSVYNLIGLEDSCICDHCLTDFFMRMAAHYDQDKKESYFKKEESPD